MTIRRELKGFALGFAIALSFWASPSPGQNRGQGVEVRAVSPLQVVSEPRRIQVLSFRVTNRTDREFRFREEAALPKGWPLILPLASFVLPPQGTTTRLLSFQVPLNASEGSYRLAYSVVADKDPSVRDFEEFDVTVLPLEKTDLMVENQPDSLMAGDEFEIAARLVNSGNTTRTFALKAKTSDPGSSALVDPAEAPLAPGEGVPLKVTGKVNPQYLASVMSVQVTATAPNKEGKMAEVASATILLEIIPTVSRKAEPYHVLPTTLSLSLMKTSDGDTKPFLEWSGSGTLDEEGEQEFSFSFSGPAVEESTFFSEQDEYWIDYSSPRLGFLLGDQPYGVSPLTVNSSYGRGVGAEFRSLAGRWSIGGFRTRSRFGGDGWVDQGLFVEHSLGVEDTALRLNVTRSETDATTSKPAATDNLWSLEARLRPGKDSRLELEYGQCDTDRPAKGDDEAYRAEWRGLLGRRTAYTMRKIHAGADYWGYYHSYDYESAALDFPLGKRLRAGLAYSRYEDNLDRRSEESDTATTEYLAQATLNYDLLNGWFLVLGYDDFDRIDQMAPAEFDYSEKSYWLRIGRTLGQFSWSVEPRFSDQADHLSGESRSAWNASILLSWFASSNLSFSLYWNIGDNDILDESYLLRSSTAVGGSVFWRPSPQWTLNLAYSKSGIGDNGDNESDQFDLTATYAMPDERELVLDVSTERTEEGDNETEFRLSYRIPIGIKTVKRKNIGILKGRVFDAMNPDGPGMAGIVVRVGAETAVTDQEGNFLFPALSPGMHRLLVDPKSIGFGFTTTLKYPISLEVVGGGDPVSMDIGITRGATFRGKVFLPDIKKANGKDGFVGAPEKNGEEVMPGEMASILVELSREDEVIRRATDGKGEFLFENIRPGTWNLKFYEAGLPTGYYLETGEKTIELAPGDSVEFINRALPRKRGIKFIDSGSIVTSPAKKAPGGKKP